MEGLIEGGTGLKKLSIVKSADVIKILSAEGKAFYVNKDVLMISKHFATVINSGFKEGETKTIQLQIKTEILETCLKYLHYKLIYRQVSF